MHSLVQEVGKKLNVKWTAKPHFELPNIPLPQVQREKKNPSKQITDSISRYK